MEKGFKMIKRERAINKISFSSNTELGGKLKHAQHWHYTTEYQTTNWRPSTRTTNTTPTTEQGRGRKGWNEEHVQRGAARVITVYSDLTSDRKQECTHLR